MAARTHHIWASPNSFRPLARPENQEKSGANNVVFMYTYTLKRLIFRRWRPRPFLLDFRTLKIRSIRTRQKFEPFIVFRTKIRTLRGKIEGRARKLEPFVASSPTRKKLLYPSDAKWLCATKLIWQSRSRGFKLVCEFRET